MSLRGLLHRLRVWLSPESYAREVRAELQFHLDLEAQQRRAEGMSARDAADAARRRFGNVTYNREEVRRMTGMDWIDRLRQDLGYAWRGLRQSPGFTAGVVLTLALGLGVNAAMFSFLDGVFIKPPAGVVRPDEVRRIYIDGMVGGANGAHRLAYQSFNYPVLKEMRRTADSAIEIGIFTVAHDTAQVVVGDHSVPASHGAANTAFFRALGVRPKIGRFFEGAEDRIEAPTPVAVISYDLWQRVFGGDASALGKTFTWQDRSFTVVGVAAEGFRGIDLDRTDWWTPINYTTRPPRTPPWYEGFQSSFAVVTRFSTPAIERRFLDVATRAYQDTHLQGFLTDTTAFMRAGPVLRAMGPATQDQSVAVAIRIGGVTLLVLLIAIANVSNLLLVRATKRSREIAVRRALGVSRGRLFEQLVTESLLLSLLAGAVSLLVAFWASIVLRRLLMPEVKWADGPLDLRATGFAVAVTIVVGLLIGLAPAVHAWGTDVVSSLRAGARGVGSRRSLIRSGLLIVQASLSVVLLVGAGLFVRSLHNLNAIDLGFQPATTLVVNLISSARPLGPAVRQSEPALVARLATIPGVQAVATTNTAPLLGFSFQRVYLPGKDSLPMVNGERGPSYTNASTGYFRATGMRILDGQDLSAIPRSDIVVSETMAKAYWPGERAIGKCLIVGDRSAPCLPVVGVVADAHRMAVIENATPAQFYLNDTSAQTTIVARVAEADAPRVAAIAREEVLRILPAANATTVRPLTSYMERELRPWRLGATLFTAMGILALIVSAIGVYSVIAYAVSQRTNEMGIRIALGARLSDISGLVIGDGLRTVGIGVVVGIAASLAMARLVQSLLYEEGARDPLVIVIVAAILAAVGIVASAVPALRAGRVDPVVALRSE